MKYKLQPCISMAPAIAISVQQQTRPTIVRPSHPGMNDRMRRTILEQPMLVTPYSKPSLNQALSWPVKHRSSAADMSTVKARSNATRSRIGNQPLRDATWRTVLKHVRRQETTGKKEHLFLLKHSPSLRSASLNCCMTSTFSAMRPRVTAKRRKAQHAARQTRLTQSACGTTVSTKHMSKGSTLTYSSRSQRY